jgi:hypothetical protein
LTDYRHSEEILEPPGTLCEPHCTEVRQANEAARDKQPERMVLRAQREHLADAGDGPVDPARIGGFRDKLGTRGELDLTG